MKRFLIFNAIIVASVLAVGGLAACGIGNGANSWNAQHGLRDAPVNHSNVNNGPAHIITMPDGFMNVAFKCDGHNGIYAHTRQAAPVIVPNDPNCVK